jgi:hypothetical protein
MSRTELENLDLLPRRFWASDGYNNGLYNFWEPLCKPPYKWSPYAFALCGQLAYETFATRIGSGLYAFTAYELLGCIRQAASCGFACCRVPHPNDTLAYLVGVHYLVECNLLTGVTPASWRRADHSLRDGCRYVFRIDDWF